MIAALKKRFVRVAMTAVTLLLVVVLGTVNLANLVVVRREAGSLLTALSLPEERPAMAFSPARGEEPPEAMGRWDRWDREDELKKAVYFTARVSEEGELASLDLDRFGALTEEEARELVEAAVKSGRKGGSGHGYRWSREEGPDGALTYRFLDTSRDTRSLWRVGLFSLGVGALAWLLMLLIVIRLSARAVRPFAENVEKQKRFITDAGHEIKTPLAIIQANVEAMELIQGENKWSRNIKEQTARLGDLTRNLLTLSRMEEGQEKRAPQSFDLAELTEKTLLMFGEMAESRELELSLELEPGITVTADREEIGRLLSLLTDNAVKYCPEGGALAVSLKKEGKTALLTMENDCENLETLDTERIFDRFYRADESRDRKSGGYGIGLATALAIAKANGGSLLAEKGKDRLRFLLRLPQNT